MINLHFKVKELLGRRAKGKFGALLLTPVTLLSGLYALIQYTRRNLYREGVLKSRHAGVPTVCVGNITLGGTGKTPCVETVCRLLLSLGKKPVIIARGYGGSMEGDVVVVSDGREIKHSAAEVGDEPLLLSERLLEAGVPVVIGAKRYDAARLAVDELGAEAIVMDDGFQHLAIKRDLNIVVIDASRPFGNLFCLPRGSLREPLSALRDAQLFLLTRAEGVGAISLNALKENLAAHNPQAPIITAAHTPDCFREAHTNERLPLAWVEGRKILAFAGIGNPGAFFLDLEELGARLLDSTPFPDHHEYTSAELGQLAKWARLSSASALVTTEKDLVRIEGLIKPEIMVAALLIKMSFSEQGGDILKASLEGIIQP
ncbi:MAG: tetraacyldisaccharide 4'-kinase [Deltaproteobacteria bacterium]|nr:MAG: tetraacyldisaccharide 4'-kinase [Deltaproteobacteria bacterium]